MNLIPALRTLLERLRLHYMGRRDALALALFGLAIGLISGVVTLAFRGAIELTQFVLVPAEGYAAMDGAMRFGSPIIGAMLAVGLLYLVARGPVRTGVVHVLEELACAEGRLPFRNAAVQFIAAALLLIFGMSMGREGPAIHLGAASGSLLGERLRTPARSLRTLVGCGVAAAIGGAFNTPLAGVILAMEVVLMEYTIDGFTPILLAGVSGATLSRLVYGNAPAFVVPQVALASLWELPYMAAMGVAIGAYAALFIVLSRSIMRGTRQVPWWIAMIGAGVLVGALGMFVPQVLGIGYDVVGATLAGQYALGTLALIIVVKVVATGIGVGARLPAGLIGPTLVMGAAAGAVFGTLSAQLVPHNTSNVTLYAMLGMGAMMGATLQAPLAALLAVLELTGNPHLILPGMLAIVSASLAAKQLFHCESVFAMQLREMGLPPQRAADTSKDDRARGPAAAERAPPPS